MKRFRKKTDRRTFLKTNSEHLKSFKNSIRYSQTLRINIIYSTKKDFDHHSGQLKKRFLKEGFGQKPADKQLKKVDKLVKDDTLQEKDGEQQDTKRIPLILTYIRFLPNLTAFACKNWKILQTNKKLRELYQEHRITPFKRSKNLTEIIGGTQLENGKIKIRINIPYRTGKCITYLPRGKNSMLQPSDDNEHMNETTEKEVI